MEHGVEQTTGGQGRCNTVSMAGGGRGPGAGRPRRWPGRCHDASRRPIAGGRGPGGRRDGRGGGTTPAGDPIMTSYGPIKKSDGCNPARYLTAPGAGGRICLWSIADLALGFPHRQTHWRIS